MIPNHNLIKAIWVSVGKTVREGKMRSRWKP